MRPVRVLGLYLAFVFLGAALLSPWAYQLVHLASGWFSSLQSVADKPFPRYVNRSLIVLALAGLVPFLKAAHLKSWRELGLPKRSDAWQQIGWGFLVGFTSLALVVCFALITGARQASTEHGVLNWAGHLIKASASAAFVAFLEEVIFRGALFGALRKTFHWTLALGISSIIYALVHFFERPGGVEAVGWSSGLIVLGKMLGGFTDWEKIVPGALSLTVAGLILGLAYQRSGSLHFSIGLHAGWIFWLKTYGFVTDDTAQARTWLFGSAKMVDGWLAFFLLAGCLVLLNRFLAREGTHSGWKERKILS